MVEIISFFMYLTTACIGTITVVAFFLLHQLDRSKFKYLYSLMAFIVCLVSLSLLYFLEGCFFPHYIERVGQSMFERVLDISLTMALPFFWYRYQWAEQNLKSKGKYVIDGVLIVLFLALLIVYSLFMNEQFHIVDPEEFAFANVLQIILMVTLTTLRIIHIILALKIPCRPVARTYLLLINVIASIGGIWNGGFVLHFIRGDLFAGGEYRQYDITALVFMLCALTTLIYICKNDFNVFFNGEIDMRKVENRIQKERAALFFEQSGLTKREKEVAELLIEGLRYEDIAEQLHISINTVKRHIQNIYKKADVTTRDEFLKKLKNRG